MFSDKGDLTTELVISIIGGNVREKAAMADGNCVLSNGVLER